MKLSVIILGGVVAGASAFAPPSFARDATVAPAAAHTGATAATPATTPKAAAKKPAGKPGPAAARRGKDETGSLPEASAFAAEAVGWELVGTPRPACGSACRKSSCRAWALRAAAPAGVRPRAKFRSRRFRLPEAALPALFDEERKSAHRQVASSNLKPDNFFILGTQGLKNFVVRAAAQGSEVRGVTSCSMTRRRKAR